MYVILALIGLISISDDLDITDQIQNCFKCRV